MDTIARETCPRHQVAIREAITGVRYCPACRRDSHDYVEHILAPGRGLARRPVDPTATSSEASR